MWIVPLLGVAATVVSSIDAAKLVQLSAFPSSTILPVLDGFVSFSIELSSFPDFAGNLSVPNTFSHNLLESLGNLSGSRPYIRVGGNTQDYALYNASLAVATNGTVNPAKSLDYPTTLYIGPTFFESYSTWPGIKFSHGFNLGNNHTEGRETLLATVPLACAALQNGKLYHWELGNEPDLFSTSAQGAVRPPSWNEAAYVQQWLNGTRSIKEVLSQACPNLTTPGSYNYLAPSFAGTNNHLNPVKIFHSGLTVDDDIALISSHNYIGGATQPGVTLQGTLMNHTMTVASIARQTNVSARLSNYSTPFILGETNSLYNEGTPGLSNSFGAALWGVDFNLWCASQGIQRVHMHQGTNYRYAAWQPIDTAKATKGTKAPYYGSVAVAAMVKGSGDAPVQIANLRLASSYEAAYAAYVGGALTRIAVVNLREYNYTTKGTASPLPRKVASYTFGVPAAVVGDGGMVRVQRLMANGSDAITGITWDGWSYNYELSEGRPSPLANVTTGEEAVVVMNGSVTVKVPYSSAVILNLR